MNEINWPDIRKFIDQLVAKVYQEVLPLVQGSGGDLIDDRSSGKDLQAKIDKVAGEAIRAALKKDCPLPCALLDEGTGILQPLHEHPQVGFVVDEIDGTRPVRMKMQTSTICVAAFPMDNDPWVKNVRVGAVHTLDGNRFSFERGAGIWKDGQPFTAKREMTPLHQLRHMYEMAGAHQLLAAWYLMPFAGVDSYGYASFNSATYMSTRLLLGGVDFYVHLGPRIKRDWPELAEEMDRLHGGAIGQFAWDIATTTPLMREAGFIVTRTDCSSLDEVRIDDGSLENVHDVLIARTSEIHQYVRGRIDAQAQMLREHKDEVLALINSCKIVQ